MYDNYPGDFAEGYFETLTKRQTVQKTGGEEIHQEGESSDSEAKNAPRETNSQIKRDNVVSIKVRPIKTMKASLGGIF